jgi:hypothetical protein
MEVDYAVHSVVLFLMVYPVHQRAKKIAEM